jgi:mono/diheme cytochrome c family protein
MTDPVALKRGKAVFTGTCGGYCHGVSPGLRDAPYLFDCIWIHGGSDAEIFATISNGVPKTPMVSFSGKLPEGDDDIWRIISYLKSERIAC